MEKEDDHVDWMDEPRDPVHHNYAYHSPLLEKLKQSIEPIYNQTGQKHLWDELTDHLEASRENTDQTIMEHKKDKPSQRHYDDLLKRMISGHLSDANPSAKAKAHWANHGIKY